MIAPSVPASGPTPRERTSATWGRIDQPYETLRSDLLCLFGDLGITTGEPMAA